MDTGYRHTPDAGRTAEVATVDLEHLRIVEHILKAMTKLIHGRKLYAENNPRLGEFENELRSSLREFFTVEDELILAIGQYAISWQENAVYENEKREESVAFLLYRDGIGEITIEPQAIGDEVDALVRILTDEFYNVASDEDVVTKFWNADFEHISYRVLDDYLSNEYGEGKESDGGGSFEETDDHPEMLPSLADKGRVIVHRDDPLESIDAYLKRLILDTCPSAESGDREAYFQNMVGSFFAVSNEEINLCQAELQREKQSDALASFFETIFVFTLLKDNPSAVRDVAGVSERIVDFVVDDLDPHSLLRILRSARELHGAGEADDAVTVLCDRVERRVAGDDVIEALGGQLFDWSPRTKEILEYFAELGRSVVVPLLKVLHNVEGERLHREICDVLIAVGGGDVGDIVEKLDIDRPDVAFDAVYIANTAGIAHLTPRLGELVHYPDPAVKTEMIALLGRVDDPMAVDLLLAAIDDDGKRIRIHAVDAVAEKGGPDVRQRLAALAFSKEFSEREPDEQEAVFKALGRVGDAGTVEGLRRFIEKKVFMQFGKSRENKFLAIRALENIRGSASLGLLKKLTEDSNSLVQARARRACDSLSRAMREARSNEERE